MSDTVLGHSQRPHLSQDSGYGNSFLNFPQPAAAEIERFWAEQGPRIHGTILNANHTLLSQFVPFEETSFVN
jgi:hypothetical protein